MNNSSYKGGKTQPEEEEGSVSVSKDRGLTFMWSVQAANLRDGTSVGLIDFSVNNKDI